MRGCLFLFLFIPTVLFGYSAIQGTVRDTEGGGISDIYISVYDANSNLLDFTSTDSGGGYTVSYLSPGVSCYLKTSSTQNYLNEWYGGVLAGNCDAQGERPVGAAAVEVLFDEQTVTDIDFELAAGGVVKGVVTNSGGDPVQDVWLHLYYSDYCTWAKRTDATGLFEFYGLTTGTYYVWADAAQEHTGYLSQWYNHFTTDETYPRPAEATAIAVVAGSTNAGINFGLDSGGSISGRVTALSTGEGLAYISVLAFDTNFAESGFASTDSEGRYLISGLSSGLHTVATSVNGVNYINEWYDDIASRNSWMTPPEAARIPVREAFCTSGVDFALANGAVIEGDIKDDQGDPVVLGRIYAHCRSYDNSQSAYSDGDGHFVLMGLWSDTYYLNFLPDNYSGYVPEWYDDLQSPSSWAIPAGAAGITVIENGPTSRVEVVLSDGGQIRGRVTDSEGTGLENIQVSAQDTSAGPWYTADSTETDAEGYYILNTLGSGLYYVKSECSSWMPAPQDHAAEWYDNIPWSTHPDPTGKVIVVVQGSVVSNIDFSLAVGGCISGRVTQTGGQPIGDLRVRAVNTSLYVVARGETDAGGGYLIAGLSAGNYYVQTDEELDPYIDEFYDNRAVTSFAISTNASLVTVHNGAVTAGVHFVLATGGEIRGRVTGGGQPLDSVWVAAYNSINHLMARDDELTTNGEYSIPGLPAGNYYVRTEVADGWAAEWYDNVAVTGSARPSAAAIVHVVQGAVTQGVHFALVVGGVITGRVIDSLGKPMPAVGVTAYTMDFDSVDGGGDTDTNGYYAVTGLSSGRYYLVTWCRGYPYIDEWYSNISVNGNADLAMAIPIKPGAVTGSFDFVLGPETNSVLACVSNGVCYLDWDASAGRLYQVQISHNLINWSNAVPGTNRFQSGRFMTNESSSRIRYAYPFPLGARPLFGRVKLVE